MRRSWSVVVAAAVSLFMVGCGSQKKPAPASGSQIAKGVVGQYFYVNLFTPPLGGTVTSDIGGIACGASSMGTPTTNAQGVLQYNPVYYTGASSCGLEGQTRFQWSQAVTLTAAPQGTNVFLGWAGDCSGGTPTCTLSAGADKAVVAVFGPPGSGHSMPFPNAAHGPAFLASVKPDAPKCTTCHGSTFDGQSIAPSCNACHAAAGHPDWQNECTFCHGAPPTTAAHPVVSADLNGCAVCHPDTVTSAGAIVAGGKHMDGEIQFTGGHAPGFGSPSVHAPAYFDFLGSVPGAKNCTGCHGQTYGGAPGYPSCNACHASAGWVNWQQSCSFCHGLVNDTTKGGYDFALHPEWAAPPYDVDGRVKGTNGPAVGAHQAHVATNAIRAPIACSECHVVPATAIHTLNGSIDITFGPLSQSDQAHPTFNSSTLTCSATYCHGNFSYGSVQGTAASPSWGQTLTGCTSCHGMPPTGHKTVGASAAGCSTCHPDTVLPSGAIDLVKGRHVNGVNDVTGGACDSCHWFPYPSEVPPAPPYQPTGAHLAHYGLVGQGTTDYGDLDTLEVKFPTPPPPTSAYAFGCGNCHPSVTGEHSMLSGGTTAKVVLFESNLAPALKSKNASTASFTGGTCSGVYCHGNVTATPAWNSGSALACNGCHGTSTANGLPDYASGSPKANSHPLHGSYACSNCHVGTTTTGTTIANTALHVNGRYDLAPGPGVSFTYTFASTGGTCSNISCHFGGTATWGPEAGHLATLGSGEVMVFELANGDHGDNHTINQSCATCHYPSLVTQHASRCAICHEGANPAGDLIGTWNKSCSTGACHPSIHVGLGSDHHGVYWNSSASCDLCHDTSGSEFPGPGDNCTRCHSPSSTVATGDTTPPATTSNVNPAAGAVLRATLVTLSATDAGSGVRATYYRIDSGAFTQGTSFAVPDGIHTFSYYSVDNADNTETVHVSNSFRVDTIAPVTTSTAANGATYTGAQTFSLSASDAGSGVASTWYRIDAGAWAAGTSVAVSAPASGSVSRSLSWYSLDVAGNQEATKSVTFNVQASSPPADTTPPTTTSSFNPAAGANFRSNQPVTLTATDGGTGVKSTHYRIDSGTYVQGTSFLVTEGLHTFSYYSVDNANNTETAHVSNSFRVDTVAPVTTSTATNGASYTGAQTFTFSAADTAGSGVASTWYQLDAGVWTVGTSVAVSAPASGSASHTLSWYSLDIAGNPEVTRSATFTVAAPVTGGTTHISFRTNCNGYNGWYGVTWQVRDAVGTVLEEFYNDDCGHPSTAMWADYDMPSGVAYELWGEFWDPEANVALESASRTVTPAEAAPGATIEWWFN